MPELCKVGFRAVTASRAVVLCAGLPGARGVARCYAVLAPCRRAGALALLATAVIILLPQHIDPVCFRYVNNSIEDGAERACHVQNCSHPKSVPYRAEIWHKFVVLWDQFLSKDTSFNILSHLIKIVLGQNLAAILSKDTFQLQYSAPPNYCRNLKLCVIKVM